MVEIASLLLFAFFFLKSCLVQFYIKFNVWVQNFKSMVLLSMCIVIARHCSSFPSHISIFQWKKDIHLFTKQTLYTKGSTIFHPLLRFAFDVKVGIIVLQLWHMLIINKEKTISKIFWQIKNIPAYVYIYHLFFWRLSCLQLKHHMRDG